MKEIKSQTNKGKKGGSEGGKETKKQRQNCEGQTVLVTLFSFLNKVLSTARSIFMNILATGNVTWVNFLHFLKLKCEEQVAYTHTEAWMIQHFTFPPYLLLLSLVIPDNYLGSFKNPSVQSPSPFPIGPPKTWAFKILRHGTRAPSIIILLVDDRKINADRLKWDLASVFAFTALIQHSSKVLATAIRKRKK